MKRLLIAVTIIFGIALAQLPTAQAMDFFVGTSPATGMKCYLITESITELRRYSDGGRFAARLKMVGKTVQYLGYELDIGTSGIMFENSEGYSGEVTPEGTPIEWNMSQYIAENYLWR